MSPYVIYILLCAASTAPGDCDTRSAIDVVLGPEANNEIMCGLESQEMLAKTSLRPRDGEYVKISCARRRPPQTGWGTGALRSRMDEAPRQLSPLRKSAVSEAPEFLCRLLKESQIPPEGNPNLSERNPSLAE
jgi:hypothetical protein